MAFDTQIQIFLDGTPFTSIINFSLEENIGKHTLFKVSVRGQSLEDTLKGNSILERSRDFLGKRFTVAISGLNRFGYTDFQFHGTITQVRGRKGKEHGGVGDIIDVAGYSNSIFLDDGSHMDSFSEKSLSDIVEQIVFSYSNPILKVKTAPQNNPTIHYAVQNKQSAFEYLQYLAASNGEYLLYNRDTLYFGKPDLGEETKLIYGTDLKDFSLGLETQSLNFKYFSNDYFSESDTQAEASAMNSNASGYTAMVTDVSSQTYPKINHRLFSTFEDTNLQQRIDTAVGLQKKLTEQKQVTLHGESVNTGVSLGKIVNIKSDEGSFGSYRVIAVKHSYGINGKYKNEFTAVPLEIDVYPLTDIAIINKAEPQIAKVKNITDPEGMSRIKVQFPWQVSTGQTTPWIRVATPYGGADRGFHVLPEVNDEVLIGFENGEVERPFMQSALYTGVNKHTTWQSENNDFKGITTKGGHIIELNDTKGGEMITITDKNGNMLRFDAANNNVEITALESMLLKSKNLTLDVTENMNIIVGKNTTIKTGEDLDINATNLTKSVENDLREEIGGDYTQITSNSEIQSDGDMKIEGAGITSLKGGNDVKISKG